MARQHIAPEPALVSEIAMQCERVVSPDAGLLADEIISRFGNSVMGILLYGSCLRSHNFREGVADLYVVVDNYKNAYRERYLRIFNEWLPPNVFYMDAGENPALIRAKYAVISLEDLHSGCVDWHHSYLWSRFAQPVRMLYARDDETRNRIYAILASAVMKFLRTTVPALAAEAVDAEAVWTNGLTLTYAAELRPESKSRPQFITHQNLGDFKRLTDCAAPGLQDLLQARSQGYFRNISGPALRRRTLRQWWLRRFQGRFLSVLRLMKAVFTFKDCVDYAAWKISRHTGICIEVTPRLQRHPILFGFAILWQLIRRNALH